MTTNHIARRLDRPLNDLSLVAVIHKNRAKAHQPPNIVTYHIATGSKPFTDDLGNEASHILFDPTYEPILTFLSETKAQTLIDLSWEQHHNPNYPHVSPDLEEHWISIAYLAESPYFKLDNPHTQYELLIQNPVDYKNRQHGPGTIIGTNSQDPNFKRLIKHASHVRFV